MTDRKPYNVLFVCTGNSARSVMAEALMTVMSNGRCRGYSCGSHPTGRVNPFAIEQVTKIGYDISNLRSKSWDEFTTIDAPVMDFIITVCGNAAGETCPSYPGRPVCGHWGFEDPAAATGSDNDKRLCFTTIFGQIQRKVREFVKEPIETMERKSVEKLIRKIGELPVE